MQDWLITTIIKSAATKIAMMFNPVGAIIQAIMMIYRTVMFFIENIDRILDFVEAIIESVYNIATGAIGSAADWIEKALARTVPVIIAFLARLLGLSGIADKIKGFILKTQSRVDKAIDKVIDKIVGGIKKLFGRREGRGR
jgi:phage-related protein